MGHTIRGLITPESRDVAGPAKEKESETVASEAEDLLNKIRTLFQWHPLKKHLSSFADQHRMNFYHKRKTEEAVQCSACKSLIDGAMYGCDECNNFLHKACAELPEKINHPSHRPEDRHLLDRFQDLGADLTKKKCSGCDLPLRDTTAYGCRTCDVYLHKFCIELPEKIKHPRHPSHHLSLQHDFIGTFWCAACSKDHKGLNYSCESCDFDLGISCIVREATRPDGNQGHILSVLRNKSQDEECLACGKSLGPEVVFRCLQCEFSLHTLCVLEPTNSVLPPKARIENHPHPLKFTNSAEELEWGALAYCDVCQEEIDLKHPLYHCSRCNYDAHFQCAFPELKDKAEAGLRPEIPELSTSIEGSFHPHPLFLADSSFSVYGAALSFECDVCGLEGYPTLPFYACAQEDCSFAVHLSCVLKERKLSFAHKLDYVVLDTSPVVITDPSPRVSEIMDSISDEEKKKLSYAVKAATARKVTGPSGATRQQNQGQDQDQEPQDNTTQAIPQSSSDHDSFDQIIKRFDSKCRDWRSGLTYYELQSQVTTLDHKYIISTNLAPVLKLLLSRHGDFSQNSTLTEKGKTFVFMVLCAALYSICTTKEGDANEIQLFTSWDCFKIAQNVGFEVDFAFKRLRKAMHFYFSLGDANAKTDTALAELDEKMSDLAPEMKTLHEKCAKRVTSVLSNSATTNETIEIVGKIEVPNSWHKYWDSFDDDLLEDDDDSSMRSEISTPMSEPLSPTDAPENGIQKFGHPLEDLWNSIAGSAESLGNKIESFIKKHPLKRSLSYFANRHYSLKEKSDRVLCWKCKQIAEDPTHGCVACDNMTDLPNKILSDFHDHPLGLRKASRDKSTTNKKKIKEESLCSACWLPISYPSYHCAKCNIFFHNFCVQFPAKIDHHPLHPSHPLSLEANSKRLQKLTCNACGEKCRGLGFSCEQCKFYLEIQCLFSAPTVHSQSHGKLLLFLEKRQSHSLQGCFACNGKLSGPPFLRCAPCNISLHVRCADLASTVEGDFDEHPLTLTSPDSRTTDGPLDQLCCKLCKKQRNNSLLPIYYCDLCKTVAHIDCVNSAVN